ncbi:unnamed protein product [Lota lota]
MEEQKAKEKRRNRERMIVEYRIMFARYKKEVTEIQRLNRWYRRREGTLTPTAADQHFAAVDALIFRAHVVKQRMIRVGHRQRNAKSDHRCRESCQCETRGLC